MEHRTPKGHDVNMETGAGVSRLSKQKAVSIEEVHKMDLKLKELDLNLRRNTGKGHQLQSSGFPLKQTTTCKVSEADSVKRVLNPKPQLMNDFPQEENVTVKTSSKGPQPDTRSQISREVGDGSGAGPSEPGRGNTTTESKNTQTQCKKEKKDVKRSTKRIQLPRTAQPETEITVSDYLILLKILGIKLPGGVLKPKVIKLSQDTKIIQNAQEIVKELELFNLKFNAVPRLGCREIKSSLPLLENKQVLEITMAVFFKNGDGDNKKSRKQWEGNVSCTACGFSFRDRYKQVAISTPAMYFTAQTRSWQHLQAGEKFAEISRGVQVFVSNIEREYCDESTLVKDSSGKNFGIYHQNPHDELECLKFYHELCEPEIKQRVKYTKGNKLEFGFLCGNLDFLAVVNGEQMAIECKGTTGDMVGKVFSKPIQGHLMELKETHQYCYQVQGYMYILQRVTNEAQSSASEKAVMVIRHYHENGQPPRDFYWNYIEKNKATQQRIEELCSFCEQEALACFLAVLSLIFQKDK